MYIFKTKSSSVFKTFLHMILKKMMNIAISFPRAMSKADFNKNCNHTPLLFIEVVVPRQESELSLICMLW